MKCLNDVGYKIEEEGCFCLGLDGVPVLAPTMNFDSLYFGIELEFEKRIFSSCNDFAYRLDEFVDRHNYGFLCEDGSLIHGLEMVSRPGTFEYLHKFFTDNQEDFRAATTHCKGDEFSSTTGCHIHISRSAFTTYHLGKFLVFFFLPCNRQSIIKVAGRNNESFASFEQPFELDIHGDKSETEMQSHIYSSVRRYGKYMAVNLTKPNTVEVRIFKGTRHAKRVRMFLEFTHAAFMFTKVEERLKCLTWEYFILYIELHKGIYPELSKEIKENA